LMVTMSQKSSLLQHANSVSQVLIPDTRSGRALMLSVTRCAFLSPQLRRRARPQAALNSETEGSASIVPNEEPRYWAGLEVDGFPSGTSTSFLKKVRMRSRWEAAMS